MAGWRLVIVVLGAALLLGGRHAITVAAPAPGTAPPAALPNTRFTRPSALTIDSNGTLYILDPYNQHIRTLSATGEVGTLTGSGACFTNGRFTCGAANLDVDADGTLYFASGRFIYRITADGHASRWAGAAYQILPTDAPFHEPEFRDGPADVARFGLDSKQVAVDGVGGLYVVDPGNQRLRHVAPDGSVSTVAVIGYTFGGITVDSAGNILVAQSEPDQARIDKITPDGIINTLAGSGSVGLHDGTVGFATFDAPQGVAVNADGNVFVADSRNNRIRIIAPDGTVSTYAGTGPAGNSAAQGGFVDGPADQAQFNHPEGVVVGPDGTVYVADTGNHAIRAISAVGLVTTIAGDGQPGYADSPTEVGSVPGVAR